MENTTKNEESTSKPLTPPYLSRNALDRVLSLISTRTLDKVDFEYLASHEFGKSDAYTAIVALRFLGLIDERGSTTEKARSLHLQGEAQKKALEEIVRVAYERLFKAVGDPYKLPSKELFNEFIAQYHVTPRIARTAVPAFLMLCSRAGLIEEEVKTHSRKRGSTIEQKVFGGETTFRMPSRSQGGKSVVPLNKLEFIRDVLVGMKIDLATVEKEKLETLFNNLKDLMEIATSEEKKGEQEDIDSSIVETKTGSE